MERVSTTPPMEEGLLADVAGLNIPSLIPKNEDLAHVLEVLCATGYGAWVVGGAVRDCILGELPNCLLYTSPSPRDGLLSRMPSSA